MTVIAVDGLSEEDFRRSIEIRLREGKPAVALERIRRLLADFAGPDRILPERFLSVEAKDLVIRGWQALEPAIARHDRPGRPVTALSVAFGWPGDELPLPDSEGRLSPHIETGYFTDDAYPFSHSARDDLLDGYSFHGCTWAADCEAVDNALSLEGVDDLHGALVALEARLLASEMPDPDEILAGSLGSCLLSVLLFEAVGERIARDGLPRPICVMAGSNGVYPYFDAPVAGFPEEARKAADAEEDETSISTAIPAPRYSSLLMTGVPRGAKRAVLVLQETEAETAARFANLRDQSHIDPEPDLSQTGLPQPELSPDPIEPAMPEPEIVDSAASPLLVKKQPGKAWDFRDMLSPSEPEATQALSEERDWDDWSEPSPPEGERAPSLDSGSIDWGKPFEAPPPLGFEPPAARPEPVDWDSAPVPPEPVADFAPSEPVDWPESPESEEVHPLETGSNDWGEPSEALSAPGFEPPAIEPESVDRVDSSKTPEPIAGFALSEPVDWPESPESGEAQSLEPESIDWCEPPEVLSAAGYEPPAIESKAVDWADSLATPETPDPVGGLALSEPVDWPQSAEYEEEQSLEPGSIDWGQASEAPPLSSEPPAVEPESVEWPEHLAKPGFALLEPILAEPVSISYAPLAPLVLAEPEPESEPEPEPVATDPRDLPVPDWPLGLGWLEDHQEATLAQPAAEPPSSSLWARLRGWIRR